MPGPPGEPAPLFSGSKSLSADEKKQRTQRLLAMVKTTVCYGIAEPLCYAFMTSVSSEACWWLLFAAYMSSFAPLGALFVTLEGVKEMKAEHERDCSEALVEEALDIEDSALAEQEKEANQRDTDPPANEGLLPSSKTSKLICDKHGTPWKVVLAPLLPTFAAAATNAALVFYARYFSTEHSSQWIELFAFGWTVIALLVSFFLVMAKVVNADAMAKTFNRRGLLVAFWRTSWRDWLQRLGCLVMLLAVKGMVRRCLGLSPWILVRWDSNEFMLVVEGELETGQHHAFDQLMKRIPPWVSWVAPVLNVVCIVMTFWYHPSSQRGEVQEEQA